MEKENKIFELFQAIGVELNNIGVEPVVYGSLGLYLLGMKVEVNDIDFLVEDSLFDEKWRNIKKILIENFKCEVDPDHERELDCVGISVSFLKLSDILHLTGIDFSNLRKDMRGKFIYRSLTLQQHLDIYQNGLKNKWRRLKKEVDDLKKIENIKNEIRKEKE